MDKQEGTGMNEQEKVIKGLECCIVGEWLTECGEGCPYNGTGKCHELMPDALALLKASEPIRHGRWVEETDRYYHWHCSECGIVYGMGCKTFKRCPICGAKMDLEE